MRTDRALLLALIGQLGLLGPAVAGPPPNILIVILDDVGVDQFASYDEAGACSGNNAQCFSDDDCPGVQTCELDYPLTPTIDGIAEEGVLFRNVYASASCRPARAAAITGRYGVRTGVLEQQGGPSLDRNERLMPAALADPTIVPAAYASAAIGKWGLGSSPGPLDRGFDHFAGALGSGIGDYFNWQRTVDTATSTCSPGSAACPLVSYTTTVQVNDALSWLSGQAEPWFLWFSFNAPHSPYHVPPHELVSASTLARLPDDGMGGPAPPGTTCSGGDRRICYMAAIEAADAELSRLLAAVPDNTWVFVLGDNGTPAAATRAPFDSDHAKGTVHEGGVNVPLLIRAADGRSAGLESAALVHVVDLFATVVDLAGGDVPLDRRIDGLSLRPSVDDPSAVLRPFAYTDYSSARTARGSRYKLIRDGAAEEFYDLIIDPFEQTDLLPLGLDPAEQSAYDALADEIDGPLLASGRVPDGGTVPGTGLSVAKLPGGDLSLAWSASCDAGDEDYAVYSGTLGDFDSHGIETCSTGMQTDATVTPAAGKRYYLVVPNNGVREGSYGSASNGLPRLPTESACLPRSYAGCE